MNSEVETVTGAFVDVISPKVESIFLDDIAWSLSRMPRFVGHTIPLLPYTTAQHSLHVAKLAGAFITDSTLSHRFNSSAVSHAVIIAKKEWADQMKNGLEHLECLIKIYGLLHDGAEAYTGDWPSPLKQIPEIRGIIKPIENRLTDVIYESFRLPKPTEEFEVIVKGGDKIAQAIEAHAFMSSRGKNWSSDVVLKLEELQKFEQPKPSLEIYREFKNEMQYLLHKVLSPENYQAVATHHGFTAF